MAYKFEFDINQCHYKNFCGIRQGTPEACDETCPRYRAMHYLVNTSNIPKILKYPPRLIPEVQDKQSFRELGAIKSNIKSFVESGANLYLHSENVGNGKTTSAVKLLLSYYDSIWASNGYRDRGLFIHCPTLFVANRENIGNPDIEHKELLDKLATVDLVIWDDIASVAMKEYDYLNMLSYIDKRISNGLANIYTGNLSGDELLKSVGTRLYSRIWEGSKRIEFLGGDRRGQNV